jgi:hypothetical protein
LSDDVDTYTRISDPALGQEPPLTRGVSHQSDQEGSVSSDFTPYSDN